MNNNSSRAGEFLISISNKQNKLVKFIDSNHDIKAQKIFQVLKANHYYITLVKNQFENIKDYIIRLKELKSQASIYPEMEIIYTQNNKHYVLKVNTPFCQYPNLYDFYRRQILNPNSAIKMKESCDFYIHFFQEFFQLMVKGGGIKNFFYTNQNIFIISQRDNGFIQHGKLLLNKTSLVGLKFLHGEQITKQEFIEIYPCLPPSVYTLMESSQPGSRDKLDLLIKIRSFAYLILTFILKRVPILFDQNLDTLQTPDSPVLKKLIENSNKKMELLLELVKDKIKDVEKLTKIKLREFFKRVFVLKELTHQLNWLFVFELFFQRNFYNEESFQMTYTNKYNQDNRPCLQNRVFFQKIVYQMWEMEPNKKFYIQRGFVELPHKRINMVYFLIKVNANFHKLLKFLNVIQFIKESRFSEEANQVAVKLMRMFSPKLIPKDESNPSEIHKLIEESRKQSQKITQQNLLGNELTFYQQSDMNLFNPFAFKNQLELQIAAKTLSNQSQLNFPNGPIEFLQNIYTYPSRSNNTNNNSDHAVTTMSRKLEALLQMKRNLWPV